MVSGTAPRLRQLITLAVVSAGSAAFTPCCPRQTHNYASATTPNQFATPTPAPALSWRNISRGTHSSLSAVGLLVTSCGLVVVVASIPLTRLTRRYLITVLLAMLALTTLGSAGFRL
jgi:hypothetical protein